MPSAAESPASDEELALRRRARRRLIGAIALVTLVVLMFPWILDKEPKPLNREISVQIPDPASMPPKSGPLAPSTAVPTQEVGPVPKAPVELRPDVDLPAVAPSQQPGAERASVQPTSAPKPATRAAADTHVAGQGQVDGPKDDGQPAAHAEFVIQLGAFTNPDNAKQLQAKLAQAGIRSYAQTLETGSGSAIRVGVGPFASRDSAEGALARVQKLGLNGSVVQR